MKIAFTLLCVFLGIGITVIVRGRRITPETLVVAVRMSGKAWLHCLCCIRDAQHDGYDYAVISSGHIVDMKTLKRTGRKLKTLDGLKK